MRLGLLFLVVCACGGNVPSKKLTLTAKGLFLTQNPFSEVPDGAFSRADNAVISRDGIVQKRRGMKFAGGFAGQLTAHALGAFGFSGQVLYVDDIGNAAHFDGTEHIYGSGFGPPSGFRPRFVQAGGAAYFTTAQGLQKLDDVNDTPVLAGAPSAIEGVGTVTGTSGFMPVNSATAYRVVWGVRDADGVVSLGAPSGRIVVVNPSGASTPVNVSLEVAIPSDVDGTNFAQVYRSYNSNADTVSPGDDMFQVYEYVPTAAELAAQSFTFTDIVPESLLGTAFYGSPNIGDGAASYKDRPPLMRDVALFAGRLWGSYTAQPPTVSLRLLSVDAPDGGLALDDVFALYDGTTYRLYTASTSTSSTTFEVVTGGTAGQNIEATTNNLVRAINLGGFYRATYLSSDGDPSPGLFSVRGIGVASPAFVVILFGGNPASFAPALPQRFVGDFSRTSNVVTVAVTNANGNTISHHLKVGQQINLVASFSADFPEGLKTVTATPFDDVFQYAETGANSAMSGGFLETTQPAVPSNNFEAKNGLSFSEAGESGAWPVGNQILVGAADKAVLRIVPLRDALYVFKEDGLFRLTGTGPEDFSVQLHDGTVILVAPESCSLLANRIWCFSTQGVVAVSETGAEVVSRPIDAALQPLLTLSADQVRSASFGIGYESEREYRLWVPTLDNEAGYATQAYVYSMATRAWTRFDVPALSGFINPADNKQWLGMGGDEYFWEERKALDASDYQDTTFADGSGEDTLAINFTTEWQIQTADSPGTLKRWVSTAVLLEDASVTLLSLSWATEYSTGFSTALGAPINRSMLRYVPMEDCRSARLTVGVNHNVIAEGVSILGVQQTFNPGSDRIGR